MDSNDKVEQQDGDNVSGELEIAPGAVLMGNMTGANMGSSTIGGLGGGPVGSVAAEEATEPVEPEDVLNLDALEAFGSKGTGTSDQGVSSDQSELEAGESNG